MASGQDEGQGGTQGVEYGGGMQKGGRSQERGRGSFRGKWPMGTGRGGEQVPGFSDVKSHLLGENSGAGTGHTGSWGARW